jgi:DNA-binding response OmpR family regulator
MQYVFGDCRLDMQRYELQRAGSLVPLDRQGFAVLAYLIEHRDRASCDRNCSTASGLTGLSATPPWSGAWR